MPRQSVVPGFRFDGKLGRAYFEVILPGTAGHCRLRKRIRVATRDQALELFRKFRTAALTRKRKPESFAAYLDRFWPLLRARLAGKTVAYESSVVENTLKPFFGTYRLEEINAALIRDFVAQLRRKRYAPATINRFVGILKKILYDAVEREMIGDFPVKGRLRREREPALRLELSDDERRLFLAAFENESEFRKHFAAERWMGKVVTSRYFGGPRVFGGGFKPDGVALGIYYERFKEFKPLFVVALETGLRRGDLLSLKWSSVDFRSGWIRVAIQKTKREALIPISEACREALLSFRRRGVVGEFVFVGGEGQPISRSTVQRYFVLAKKIAGITRRFRFHDLRHTFGSTLASKGVSLQWIAKALGHASVRMSERYARPSKESLQEIKRALDSPR